MQCGSLNAKNKNKKIPNNNKCERCRLYVVKNEVLQKLRVPLVYYYINVSHTFNLSSIKLRCSFEWRCPPRFKGLLRQCGYEFHQNFDIANVVVIVPGVPTVMPFYDPCISLSMTWKTRTSPLISCILMQLSWSVRALINARMFYRRCTSIARIYARKLAWLISRQTNLRYLWKLLINNFRMAR